MAVTTTATEQSIEATFLAALPTDGKVSYLPSSRVVVESKLMESTVGGVFLGRHSGLDAPVVIRVSHAAVRAKLKNFERFVAETRKVAEVRHRNIASILDMGEFAGHAYVVTEFVEGVPLIDRIESSPMSQSQALDLLVPIAEGLAEFWFHGQVHRAVCPQFIRVATDCCTRLDISPLRRNYTDPQFKTYIQTMMAPYWSPEEIRGQPVDPSSDMWSFGATLFHAVTGRTPFTAKTESGMLNAVLGDEPIDPATLRPEMLPAFRDLLLKLLSKKPEDRFYSAEAFLMALRSIRSHLSALPVIERTIMFSEISPGPTQWQRPSLDVGGSIGNCRLEKKLGTGAFGVVFLARHTVLDIPVAVKLLAQDAAQRDPTFVEMFLREARTAARMRHRNVIGIYEAGEKDGQHYLIMEYAPNGSVADRLAMYGGIMPPREVRKIIIDTARGLCAAEALNIIHRDIKPENLMYGPGDEVKIADMGLAKRLLTSASPNGGLNASLMADQISMRTTPGMIAGTPAYLAPEHAVNTEMADTRADQYSLGVTAYQLLTGQLPFEGKSPMETMMKHVVDPVIPLRHFVPSIPEPIEKVVLKMMAKQPGDRYPSAKVLAEEVEAIVVN
jgi:serine/threonine protein kinase